MITAATATVNTVPRTCLTLRIDVPTPLHECQVRQHFDEYAGTLYKSFLIYRETSPKFHFHIRVTSGKTRQHVHNKLMQLYSLMELKKHQHSHHTVWETVKDVFKPCKKHQDCKMGSMTYIAKNCSLVGSYNIPASLIEAIQASGRNKLLKSKLPTHIKICVLGELDQFSQIPEIIKAMKLYYETSGKNPPLYPKHLVHKLMCHLKACGYVQSYYQQLEDHLNQSTTW